MAWKGDPLNPVPNIGIAKGDLSQEIAQESSNLSYKKADENRAYQTRRDNDKQKDNTVTLLDIDTTIFEQLKKFQITVVDEGNQIKVPVFYSSPEKWKSIQTDGVLRDYNGKLILPVITLQRTNTEKDEMMRMFNRYLTYPVMKQHSEKNRYTKFSILIGENVPINEVYDVIMPDHMVLTYHFIIWTEYIEQMNTIVERLNFETEDYWGQVRGLRFRTRVDSFSHAVELQVDQDRMVKTEFDLLVNGYLLPDTNFGLDARHPTTRKWLTPKKIIISQETVVDDINPVAPKPENAEKWRNPNYPNLQKDVVILTPGTTWGNDISIELLNNLKTVYVYSSGKINSNNGGQIPWQTPPATPVAGGTEGNISYDSDYFYIYTNSVWKRLPLSLFS